MRLTVDISLYKFILKFLFLCFLDEGTYLHVCMCTTCLVPGEVRIRLWVLPGTEVKNVNHHADAEN